MPVHNQAMYAMAYSGMLHLAACRFYAEKNRDHARKAKRLRVENGAHGVAGEHFEHICRRFQREHPHQRKVVVP